MAFFNYASFPNSRDRNRAPTTQAVTYQVTVNSVNGPTPELARAGAANLNRTYIVLKNLNNSFDLYYFYVTEINFDPSSVATFGVLNQKLYNPTTKTLYNKVLTEGIDTNWSVILPAQYATSAERVEAFQAATLESLEAVWCISNAPNPVVPPGTAVTIGIDEGRN